MRLVILTGSLAGKSFEVPPEGLAVGRREECQVRFDEADDVVSGLHAHILPRDGSWVIADAGSRNGTLVDGQAVTDAPLRHGQVVTFGRSGPTARIELPIPSHPKPSSVGSPIPATHRTGLTSVYQAARETAAAGSTGAPSDTEVMKAFVKLTHERTTRRWQMVLAACLVVGVGAVVAVYLIGRRQTADLEQRIATLSAELDTQGDTRAALEAQLERMAATASAAERTAQSARTDAQRQRQTAPQDRGFGPAAAQRFSGGVGLIESQPGWHNAEYGWLRVRGTADGGAELTTDADAPLALGSTSHCTGFLVDATGLVLTNRHCVDLAYADADQIRDGTLRLGPQGSVVFTPAIASLRISFPPGRTFEIDPATIRTSREHDLGAFVTNTRPDGVPVLPLASTGAVVAGESAVLLSYPGGARMTAQRRGLGFQESAPGDRDLDAATQAAADGYLRMAGVTRALNAMPDNSDQRGAYLKSRPAVRLAFTTYLAARDRGFFDGLARGGHVQPNVDGSINVSGVRPDSISFHTLGAIGGSSGGPLISARLAVVGINHAGFSRNDRGAQYQQNEAVPVDFALRFLPAVRRAP